jgi:hypothetical protein
MIRPMVARLARWPIKLPFSIYNEGEHDGLTNIGTLGQAGYQIVNGPGTNLRKHDAQIDCG